MARWKRLRVSIGLGTAVSMAGFALAPLLGWGALIMEGFALEPAVWIVGGTIKVLLVLTRSNKTLYGWAYWARDYFQQSPLVIGLPASIFMYTVLLYWLLGLRRHSKGTEQI